MLAGTERFLVEFIRRNDHVFLGLTQAQLESLAMIAAGSIWLAVTARRGSLVPRRPPEPPRRARPSAAGRRRSGSPSPVR